MRAFVFMIAAAMLPAPLAAQTGEHDMHMHGHEGHEGHQMPAPETPSPAAAPPPAGAPYADRIFPAEEMARAREALRREHGGGSYSQILFDLAEYQARKSGDGFRWDVEGWWGGDIHRIVIKSEGEGAFGEGPETAEVQALYSHALDPYWNLQAGVRYDFEPDPSRAYAVLGFEGVAPYGLEIEGALFLSDKGDLLGRIEAGYNQLINQGLILQPRAELEFAAQDMTENGVKSGISNAELGLRLRYEIEREFAPYVGVSHERKIGGTADLARAAGEDVRATSFVMGVRAWF